MKLANLVIIWSAICFCSAQAQDRVEVFGYFESTIMGAEINGKVNQLFTNKLRVDLKSAIADNITFVANFDYSLVAIESVWRFHNYTQFDMKSMGFVELPEQRRLLGGSLAGELFGLGTWAEYGYNQMEKSKDFY
jgi:hypothetical protein